MALGTYRWPGAVAGRESTSLLAGVFALAAMTSCQGMIPSGGWTSSAGHSVESNCPASPSQNAGLVLCEDFDDGAFQSRWDIGSSKDRWPAAQFVRCDGFGFGGGCAAWSNELAFDGEWGFWGYDARRMFVPQSELYIRWYQYISDPFVWGTLEDKSVLLHDQAETMMAYVGTNRNHLPVEPNSGPGIPFVANYQDLDTPETGGRYSRVNRFQNQKNNITLQPGKWYLFEWYVKLNTPGESDGVTKLWIDEADARFTGQTLRMHYTDMRWVRRGEAGRQFGLLRLTVYHQRCDGTPNTCPPRGPEVLSQYHRWDDLVVSKAPVGARPTANAQSRAVRAP